MENPKLIYLDGFSEDALVAERVEASSHDHCSSPPPTRRRPPINPMETPPLRQPQATVKLVQMQKYARVPVLSLMLYGFTLAGTAGLLGRSRAVAVPVEVAMDSEQTPPHQRSAIREVSSTPCLAARCGGGYFPCSPRNRARAGRWMWIRGWMERGSRASRGKSGPTDPGPDIVPGLRRFGTSVHLRSPEREAASDGRAPRPQASTEQLRTRVLRCWTVSRGLWAASASSQLQRRRHILPAPVPALALSSLHRGGFFLFSMFCIIFY